MDAKFTTRSQEALGDAIQQASAAGNPQLEPAHVLSALLQQEGGVANGLLDAVGADRGALGRTVRGMLVSLPTASGNAVAQPTASRALATSLEAASSDAPWARSASATPDWPVARPRSRCSVET